MARRPRRRRRRALARVPARRVRGALPGCPLRRRPPAVRDRAVPARHRGSDPLRRGERRHRRALRRLQRRRPDHARPDRARRLPRRARGRGDDPAHPRGRPVGVRRRPDARRRCGEGVRREASGGHRTDQLDQRGDLRARTVGARRRPTRPDRVDRARDVPAHARGASPPVRAWQRRLLARHRYARQVPARAPRRPGRCARLPACTGRGRGRARDLERRAVGHRHRGCARRPGLPRCRGQSSVRAARSVGLDGRSRRPRSETDPCWRTASSAPAPGSGGGCASPTRSSGRTSVVGDDAVGDRPLRRRLRGPRRRRARPRARPRRALGRQRADRARPRHRRRRLHRVHARRSAPRRGMRRRRRRRPLERVAREPRGRPRPARQAA